MSKSRFLSGNMLKIIAAVSMLTDHFGLMFFPFDVEYRIIGRLAFPIFAFMIAEGGQIHEKQNKVLFLDFLARSYLSVGIQFLRLRRDIQ